MVVHTAFSEADGAGFSSGDIHGRAYPLACYLHQSEFAERKYVVLGPVFLHVLTHAFIELLPVFRQIHVDEVNDDNSSHITQAQLACQLVGCSQVNLQSIGFLAIFSFGSVAAIYIYHVHGLCVFNDEVCTAFVGDCFPEG